MFTSQVIYLQKINGDLKTVNGKHIHGFFFDQILSQSPPLAEYLHRPDVINPFSLSNIHRTGQFFWFRIADWMAEVSEATFNWFRTNTEIVLGGCRFQLLKTTTNPKESLWGRRSGIEEFIINGIEKIPNDFNVEHFSPTSFKAGNTHIPLPIPDLTIKSIYSRTPEMVRTWINSNPESLVQHIHLKSHKINSVYNRFGYGSIASFKGKTRWQIDNRAPRKDVESLKVLFAFAFFAGIGVKTTQGMGMCRVIPEDVKPRKKRIVE